MRFRRFKPGSIVNTLGHVADWQGILWSVGPCFIPGNLKPARKALLGQYGWHVTPVTHWPSIMPSQNLLCIHRGELK